MRDLDFDAVREFRDLIRFATGTAVDCDVARMEYHCIWRVIVSATWIRSRVEVGRRWAEDDESLAARLDELNAPGRTTISVLIDGRCPDTRAALMERWRDVTMRIIDERIRQEDARFAPSGPPFGRRDEP